MISTFVTYFVFRLMSVVGPIGPLFKGNLPCDSVVFFLIPKVPAYLTLEASEYLTEPRLL